MSKKIKILWAIFAGATLLLASCKSRGEPTEPDSKAVFTAAAETANAMMTQMAAVTPTEKPSDTPTLTFTPTVPVTPTATLTLTGVPLAGTLADRAEFVADVTVPDGSNYSGGAAFTKTWRMKNTGTSTWTSAYSLIFLNGSQMNAPATVSLQGDVPPGQTVDITVNMAAPAAIGQYTGYWIFRNPLGNNFGVGINADLPIYVLINVVSAGTPVATSGPSTPTLTQGAGTPAATTPSGSVVSNVSISVDNAAFNGSCPHIFVFPGKITLSQAATLTFQLEAGSTTPGFNFNLPAATTANMQAGTQNVTYELTIGNSVSGWARLHVTSPVDVVSNQVTFSLTCQ
jgi:hypothetical protein